MQKNEVHLTTTCSQRYADTTMHNIELPQECSKLADLVDAFRETLPGLPGFRKLSLFGSLAEGRGDEYSDIDLIVTTDDLAGAKAQLLDALEQIGPVEFCWVINLRPDEWNPTLVFRDQSYYHKLDLGLVDASAEARTIPDEQTLMLCDQGRPAHPVKESGAYVPDHGSVGHFLLGQFLGCTRYLKARRRGQTTTCYRFASAAVEWRLALLYSRLTGKSHLHSKLSSDEYQELDKLLREGEGEAVMSDIDFSDMAAMDRTMRIAQNKMLENGEHLAGMTGEVLRSDVFARMLRFLESTG